MKKIILIFSLLAIAFAGQSQATFIQLLKNESIGKDTLYRFQTVEIRNYEEVTDTLVVDRFPDKWLTSDELRKYQERRIEGIVEGMKERQKLLALAEQEYAVYVGIYDQLQGEGAWELKHKASLSEYLKGSWTLVDRNGDTTTKTAVSIEGDTLTGDKKNGTIMIADDLSVQLSGYYNFNLTFTVQPNGNLRAERGARVFVLAK